MGLPVLLAEDVYRRAGATVTDAAGATNPAYLRDSRDFLFASRSLATSWVTDVDLGVGASARAGALALVHHNLADLSPAPTVSVYAKDLPADPWALIFTATPWGPDYLATWIHDAAHRFWRVTIAAGAPPAADAQVAELLLGRPIRFTESPDWPDLDPRGETPIIYGGKDATAGVPLPVRVAFCRRDVEFRLGLTAEAFVEEYSAGFGQPFRYWLERQAALGIPALVAWDLDVQADLLWGQLTQDAERAFVFPAVVDNDGLTYPNRRALALQFTGRRRD